MIYVSNATTGEIVYSGETLAECNKWRLSHFKRDGLNEREMPFPLKVTSDEQAAEESVIWENSVVKPANPPRYAVTFAGVTINYTSKREIEKEYHISDLTFRRLVFTKGRDHGVRIKKLLGVNL